MMESDRSTEAFNNQLIVENIFKYLPTKDLDEFSQISMLWKDSASSEKDRRAKKCGKMLIMEINSLRERTKFIDKQLMVDVNKQIREYGLAEASGLDDEETARLKNELDCVVEALHVKTQDLADSWQKFLSKYEEARKEFNLNMSEYSEHMKPKVKQVKRLAKKRPARIRRK